MGISDIFKITEYKTQITELTAKCAELEQLLTPEMKDAQKLNDRIKELNHDITGKENEICSLEQDIQKRKNEINALEQTINKKNEQVLWLDDEILVQEFGLYKPQFEFANSLYYK